MRELNFDIEWDAVRKINDEFANSISEKRINLSLNRALRRTEASLRRLTMKHLPKELGLRTAAALRKRVKSIKGVVRANSSEVVMWFGLNDLPVSSFKGRPKGTNTGAEFKGKTYQGGFIGKSKYKSKQTIFKRAGKERLPITEQLYPIHDAGVIFIEDELFDQTMDIFWRHFERDIRARIKYDLGWKGKN